MISRAGCCEFSGLTGWGHRCKGVYRKVPKTVGDLGEVIEKSEIADKLGKMGYNASEISKLAVGKLHKPGRAFLDQVISSAVDVDKQDFIVQIDRGVSRTQYTAYIVPA